MRWQPGGGATYRPLLAQAKADKRARRAKTSKLAADTRLAHTVAGWLGGPHHYSPEQISHRLRLDFVKYRV